VETKVPAARTWAYCDDRSVKIVKEGAATVEEAESLRTAVFDVTKRFDTAVGLVENVKKRQEWSGVQRVEHLGLRTAGLEEDDIADIVLPAPRDGWGPVRAAIMQLHGLPGGAAAREKAATMFISPLTRWALPLMEPAPAALAKTLWQAVVSTSCSWWCQGRFWLENVQLHPVLGGSLQAMQAAAKETAMAASRTLQAAVNQHAAAIGLRVRQWSAQWGLVLEIPDGGDVRTRRAAMVAASAEGLDFVAEFGQRAFRPAAPAGAHAARVAARVEASRIIAKTRNDAEGADDIDIEAQSHPVWVGWRRSLKAEQKRQLTVWRQGAVWTPTRRWRNGSCGWCGAEWASARHLWAECPHLAPQRRRIEEIAGLPPHWWSVQPTITSKSGWITLGAAPSAKQRAWFQVAAAEMGLVVAEEVLTLKPEGARRDAEERGV
jgi:hypothetical protein